MSRRFRMLQRHHDQPCGCCSNPRPGRTYRWHAFLYCVTCLHSIGRNAAGNECTRAQYIAAWKELAS
jgi:hypothetical protein